LLTGKKSFTLFQILVATTILVIVGLSFATVAKVAADICYRCYAYSKMYEMSFRIKEAVKRDLESVIVNNSGIGGNLLGIDGASTARLLRPDAMSARKDELDEIYLVGKTYDRTSDTGLAELGWWVNDNKLMHYVVIDDRITNPTPDFDGDFKVISNDPAIDDYLEGSEEFTDNAYINITEFEFSYYANESSDALTGDPEWENMTPQSLPELIKLDITLTGKRKIKKTDELSKLSKTFSYLFYLPQSISTGFGP